LTTFNPQRLAAIALLSLAAATPSWADSFASSASSAGSKSIGSSSDSVTGSSKSSSGDTKVADGDYKVIQVAQLADKPGMLKIQLQATAQAGDAGALWLTLPQEALAQRALATGDVVNARNRPYGVEFAYAQPREAFFLVLAADWRRDLDPRAVTL
jgi:hypothetical protein